MSADEPQPIAIITDYPSLIRAFRAAFAHRSLPTSSQSVAVAAGLTSGYIGKILAPFAGMPLRGVGPAAFGAMLGVTGSKLLLVEDPQAWERIKHRLEFEKRLTKRNSAGIAARGVEFSHRKLKEMGRNGGRKAWAMMTPERRSAEIRARWESRRANESRLSSREKKPENAA